MIIDGKNLVLGRLAAYVAKQALLGNEVTIVNCKDIMITGKKEHLQKEYKRMQDMGTHSTGPFINRRPSMFVKRAIRGMLPYKNERGRKALDRIMCYSKTSEKFKEAKTFEKFSVTKLDNLNYASVQEICKHLGGKQ